MCSIDEMWKKLLPTHSSKHCSVMEKENSLHISSESSSKISNILFDELFSKIYDISPPSPQLSSLSTTAHLTVCCFFVPSLLTLFMSSAAQRSAQRRHCYIICSSFSPKEMPRSKVN